MMKTKSAAAAKVPIKTLESLYQHLQWAIEVEHFTIPPYLCALYSIPDGKNTAAARVIQSVVMEEMLHMTLVANIMNAVGTHPIIDQPNFIPKYPKHMPHSGTHFKVSLERFSRSAINTFLKIEKPEKAGAPAEPDHYHSIGQLYDAVAEGLEYLCGVLGEKKVFSGNKKRQVTPKYYYGGGGEVIIVKDLNTAKQAVEEIKEQGEGHAPSRKGGGSIFDGDQKFGQLPELAHYYRFNEIHAGKYYKKTDTPKSGPNGPKFPRSWSDVYPMSKNPRASQYPEGSEVREAMDAFNIAYTALLRILHDAFNGEPHLLQDAAGQMYKLKYQAIVLMRIPSGKGKTTVGPAFEFNPG